MKQPLGGTPAHTRNGRERLSCIRSYVRTIVRTMSRAAADRAAVDAAAAARPVVDNLGSTPAHRGSVLTDLEEGCHATEDRGERLLGRPVNSTGTSGAQTRLVSETATTDRASLFLPYLGPALAPQPGTYSEPALECGRAAAEQAHLLNAFAGMQEAVVLGGLVGRLRAVAIGIAALTEPADRVWVVELAARGRIRRGATWGVAGRVDASAVADTVADAVRRGQVPQPEGALLIDVVDQRLTVYGALR
jgi:hypothetical protein